MASGSKSVRSSLEVHGCPTGCIHAQFYVGHLCDLEGIYGGSFFVGTSHARSTSPTVNLHSLASIGSLVLGLRCSWWRGAYSLTAYPGKMHERCSTFSAYM